MKASYPLKVRLICLYEGDDNEVCPYGGDIEDTGLACWEERCEFLWLEEWADDL